MKSRIGLSLLVAAWMAVALSPLFQAHAGDSEVIPKAFDLTKGWTIPAAGEVGEARVTENPQNGAIVLAATAGLRTACVYTPIIDLVAPTDSAHPENVSGPAKYVCGMDVNASQATGTVTLTAVALYGVERSNVTTVNDQSGDAATYSGTMTISATGQTTLTSLRAFTGHIPRKARYMRFLIKNTGGVACTIPAGGLRYFTP